MDMEYRDTTVLIKVQQANLLLLTSDFPELSAVAAAAAAGGGEELVEVVRFYGDIHTAYTDDGGEELAVYFDGSKVAAFAGWRIFAYEEVSMLLAAVLMGPQAA